MKANQELLNHPFWKETDPSRLRLVRVSAELPSELNPFASDGVVFRAAAVPGETPHSKWVMAREGIMDGIKKGLIGPKTTVIEATSGNTGNAMSTVCNALGVRFVAAMSIDVPHDKIDAIRVLGRRTGLHLISDTDETTVAYARRLGAKDGWYNPCQYDGEWNWKAHYCHLAPQLFGQAKQISILALPAGTMGTCIGLAKYARDRGLRTVVVPVLCAEGQEVPGVRTLSSVRKDIRQPWEKFFQKKDLQFGTRHAAFYLSFLTWSHVTPHLGPSFGLGIAGAFSFLRKHKDVRTLEQFRDKEDGKIHVVVFGPDDCRPYLPLYFGALNRKTEFSPTIPPLNLLQMLSESGDIR